MLLSPRERQNTHHMIYRWRGPTQKCSTVPGTEHTEDLEWSNRPVGIIIKMTMQRQPNFLFVNYAQVLWVEL